MWHTYELFFQRALYCILFCSKCFINNIFNIIPKLTIIHIYHWCRTSFVFFFQRALYCILFYSKCFIDNIFNMTPKLTIIHIYHWCKTSLVIDWICSLSALLSGLWFNANIFPLFHFCFNSNLYYISCSSFCFSVYLSSNSFNNVALICLIIVL